MAATVEAARLTEAHRQAQSRIGAATVAAMVAVWPLLDADDLDGSFERWLRTVAAVVAAQRDASIRLAQNYVRAFRTLELGLEVPDFVPPLPAPVPVEQLAVSMLVTGPATLRSAVARGVPATRAASTAQARSAASAMRHALNGGRETITGTVGTDPQALGWARATSGAACAFCAMLASRGPVYSVDTPNFRTHDDCNCTPEVVYRRDADWPAGSRQYQQVWNDSTVDMHGDNAFNAFRRALAR